ncbi:hypothetical protein LINPERHAP2_LOCUS25743 [Linum perenne]
MAKQSCKHEPALDPHMVFKAFCMVWTYCELVFGGKSGLGSFFTH